MVPPLYKQSLIGIPAPPILIPVKDGEWEALSEAFPTMTAFDHSHWPPGNVAPAMF